MSLRLETFFAGSKDFEARQYRILQGLKDHYDLFSHNRLYPSLSELADLYGDLQDLLQKKEDISPGLPHELKDVDIENKSLVYEPTEEGDPDLERIIDLIGWAMPLIRKTLDEGMNIFHFVDDHIVIAEVGILPMYREEGYWFVPDSKMHQWNVLRYEVSLFTSANERFRSLRTRFLEALTAQSSLGWSPETVKLMLMEKYADLPNPATYVCETELDFPYSETILPVAKRKLMTRLFS